ncbi:MAG: metallophosphoesterase [Fibrobacterota bacterium]|nr:metallophosphoesterase [Fibrobacterota bacterium]
MSRCVFSDVSRVLAIGDLHGNFAGFKRILREAGILDKAGRWKARDTHLVQLGDILGRGGEPGKIFNLLKRLESEAPQFGSHVHVLLGNHEAMSMSGLLIYNTLEEFQDFAGQDLLEESHPVLDPKLGKRLDMLGCKEFRAALSPYGKVGSWLLGHDSAVSINGSLFVHGGLNRNHGFMPLETLNDRVRSALSDDGPPGANAGLPGAAKDIMLKRDGPQWNREFTLKPTDDRKRELDEVLKYHGCERMVVGHTPTSCIDPDQAGRILPLYGERMYCIDTGIGRTYGQHLSALSLERGAASPLYF